MHVSSYKILNLHNQSKLNSRIIYISLNQYVRFREDRKPLMSASQKTLGVLTPKTHFWVKRIKLIIK